MKTFTFRHPGFTDVTGQVRCPELSDLTEQQLGRLVVDVRRRLMIGDTFDTVERLHWSHDVGMAVWFTLHRAALDELHARAWTEHFDRGMVATPAETLGKFLRAELLLRQRRAGRIPGAASRVWWPTEKAEALRRREMARDDTTFDQLRGGEPTS